MPVNFWVLVCSQKIIMLIKCRVKREREREREREKQRISS